MQLVYDLESSSFWANLDDKIGDGGGLPGRGSGYYGNHGIGSGVTGCGDPQHKAGWMSGNHTPPAQKQAGGMSGGSCGRRATLLLCGCLQRDLTCPTDVGAADVDGLLLQLLLLLMLLPSPGRVHLAIVVGVDVAVVVMGLTLLVGGAVDSIDAPPPRPGMGSRSDSNR